MSNTPRDLDQALPIALAEFRTYIADGVIPADGTVQGWGDLAAYTDHNLIAIEAIFPDDNDGTAWTRADFDPRIDGVAGAIEAAIASGNLDVALTARRRQGSPNASPPNTAPVTMEHCPAGPTGTDEHPRRARRLAPAGPGPPWVVLS